MAAVAEAPKLVSIVLPTYSRARLLGHAIRSVLGQTYRNFELIVIDDNSKDDTSEVVRSFADPRVRYYRNQENLKLPRALNRGFELAKGAYLTWTSDDNLYGADAIGKMAAALDAGGCDFVFADYFDFARLDENGEPVQPRRVKLPDAPRLDEGNSVGACFMYTRPVYERIGPYDPELFLVEDYDYFIRVQKRFRFRHIPEALYYFSRHDEALFCSRFAEVQAAGVLVRYKNDLLDAGQVVDMCVELAMRDPGSLTSPILRNAYSLIKKTSFTLTTAYKRALRAYVRLRIGALVSRLLGDFSSRDMTFDEAKDSLRDILQRVATLEYR
jgi:glycosyltransferase involved in cell wall biosynthesis